MRLLKPKTVARLLELKPRTVTRWCREGAFPTAKKVGRSWRIQSDDVKLHQYLHLKEKGLDGKID